MSKSPTIPTISQAQSRYAEFMEAFETTPSTDRKDSVTIFGKRVSRSRAKELTGLACSVLSSQFSVYELARLSMDPAYSLEAYLTFLKETRDNPGASAKDRMVAADKIISTLLLVLKSHDPGSVLPDHAPSADDAPDAFLAALPAINSPEEEVIVGGTSVNISEVERRGKVEEEKSNVLEQGPVGYGSTES